MSSDPIDIVLIEDNPLDVELTRRALEKHHIANSMQVIEDGEEALEFLFAEGRYSDRDIAGGNTVIFLDLKLPKVNGITILRRLKADERTKTVPVVVLTASEQEKDVINSYTFGVSSYIVKPIDFEKFSRAIGQLGLYWLVLSGPPKA